MYRNCLLMNIQNCIEKDVLQSWIYWFRTLTKPEFSNKISKSSFVVSPVTIEIFTSVLTSLKHLQHVLRHCQLHHPRLRYHYINYQEHCGASTSAKRNTTVILNNWTKVVLNQNEDHASEIWRKKLELEYVRTVFHLESSFLFIQGTSNKRALSMTLRWLRKGRHCPSRQFIVRPNSVAPGQAVSAWKIIM